MIEAEFVLDIKSFRRTAIQKFQNLCKISLSLSIEFDYIVKNYSIKIFIFEEKSST